MAGVTHFERRDRAGSKKVHPRCCFCNVEFRVTPMSISKSGGPQKYIELFQQHLTDHLAGTLTDERVDFALTAMREFAPMAWDNC
jgi:hypothetical protein